MTAPPHVVVLWIGLLTAALTDLRASKIPNWLTGSMMVLGIGIHAATGPDPWLGLVGCAAAFALHFLLFFLGVEKAGDAKLMMGVGATMGWAEMLETTAWWAILFLPLGFVVLILRGRLPNLLASLRWIVDRSLGRAVGDAPEPTVMIAGPVIAVCGILSSLTDWLALPISGRL